MICDICLKKSIENSGAYCMTGSTVCGACVRKAIIFYCEHQHLVRAKSVKTVTDEVREARKEDKIRGWWA
jgi:hypothetical protein